MKLIFHLLYFCLQSNLERYKQKAYSKTWVRLLILLSEKTGDFAVFININLLGGRVFGQAGHG